MSGKQDTVPLVSVFMLAYNHERFIAQALDSILQQQVNFRYEIVVGEDCSTDNTREILLEYWRKYPGLFNLLLHEKNVGPSTNHMLTAEACKGKYVAMCEGDDYWTDPTKLQQQVDFLEANPSYSLCCHRIWQRQEKDGHLAAWNAEAFDQYPHGREISLQTVFEPYIIATASVVYRNSCLDIPVVKKLKHFKDLFLYCILLNKGRGFCMNSEMAVYRIHEKGIWSMQSQLKNLAANALTGLSITQFLHRKQKEVDEFAFHQIRNCFREMRIAPERDKSLCRYFAHLLAFEFGGYSSLSDKLKYLLYLTKAGWPVSRAVLAEPNSN